METVTLLEKMQDEAGHIHDQDKFCEIYRLQELLMRGYHANGSLSTFPLDLTDKNGVQDFRNCLYHLITEITEAEKELKNRPNYRREIPEVSPNFRKELADILHLVMELFILAGLSPHEIISDYRCVNMDNWRKLVEDSK